MHQLGDDDRIFAASLEEYDQCCREEDVKQQLVRGANPTLHARKKLSGLFEKFPKVQLEKKRGGIPAQDAEHQNYLILDHYYIYFWRTCPCAQGRVGS